ncbi:MAG: endolytic transglycosylase MltG [Acidobacteriota bacterium]
MSKARLVLLSGCLVLIASATAYHQLDRELHKAFRGYSSTHRRFFIPRGQSATAIAASLESDGIIHSARLFRWYLRLHGDSPSLRAGEYRFDRPMSLVEVAAKLRRGEIYYHKVTIPEGLDLNEICAQLASKGFGRLEHLLQIARKPGMIADLDPRATDLEGYLFPETYSLTRGVDERSILQAMVDRFRKVWTPERWTRARELGMTMREVITLASLIEKETRLPRERPFVSAVFHNRLKKNMNLECDPTVIYAVKSIKAYDGVIHRSDLRIDSPYNTYRYPGLPPGPIAAPGAASIDAALFPADVDYLYFVSKNDGSHVFSLRYRNHKRAVLKYQR